MNLSREGIEESDSATDDEEEDEVGRVGRHGLNIKRICYVQIREIHTFMLARYSLKVFLSCCAASSALRLKALKEFFRQFSGNAFVGTTVKQNYLGGEGGSEDLMKSRQQIMVRAAGPNQTRFMIGTSSGLTFIRWRI